MALEALQDKRPIRIIAMRDGILGCIVGTEDYAGARMARSPEMVLYDCGTRAEMMHIRSSLQRSGYALSHQYDDFLGVDQGVILGEGVLPAWHEGILKFRLLSSHGFGEAPLTVFDAAVEAIRCGDMSARLVPRRGGGGGRTPSEEGIPDLEAAFDAPPEESVDDSTDDIDDEFGPRNIPSLPATPDIKSAEGRKGWTLSIIVDVDDYVRRSRDPTKSVMWKGKLLLGYEKVEGHRKGKDKEPKAERDRRLLAAQEARRRERESRRPEKLSRPD